MVTEFLKNFARTDGLLKGTALLSNLVTIASISLLPGFGASGLIIATSIQMMIGGILEVPTGYLADRFGWNRCVRIALVLKVFVTSAFLGALASAYGGRPELVWLCVVAEAVIDSFANAFLSGAYQAGYLNWYRERLSENGRSIENAPPLFLSSYSFALKIRFLLPLVVLAIVLLLQGLTRQLNLLGPYAVALVSMSFIFVLRLVVLFRVHKQLSGKEDLREIQVPSRTMGAWCKLAKSYVMSGYFPAYTVAVAVNAFSALFLVGQVFRLFQSTGVANSLVWSCGILFGVGIYFVRTSLGVILFPRLGLIAGAKTTVGSVLLLGFILLLGGAVLLLNAGFVWEFSALLMMAVSCTVIADGIQRLVDSKLSEIVSEDGRATWLSFANAIGMLVFGVTSTLILLFNLQFFAIGFFCTVFFGASILAAFWLDKVKLRRRHVPSFSAAIGNVFVRATILIASVFALLDIIGFSFTALRLQKEKESAVVKLLLNEVREPLIQGSFLEATRRLQRVSNDGSILCGAVKAWGFAFDNCASITRKPWIERISMSVKLSETDGSGVGEVRLVFDRTSVTHAIAARVLFTFFLLVFGMVALTLLLRRFGLRVREELSEVLRLVDERTEDSPYQFTIQEFGVIASQLKDLIRLKTEVANQQTMLELATQVSHDIRSPISALKMVISVPGVIQESKKPLVDGALSRISEIVEGLLTHHRQRLLDATTQETEVLEVMGMKRLAALVEDTVKEQQIQKSDLRQVKIELKVPREIKEIALQLQPSMLRRVLTNLLANAVDAVEGNGRVVVELHETVQGMMRVRVSDNGKGIPQFLKSRLGTRGFTFGKKGGNGLGFWHAKKAVEGWGGHIEFQSEEGVGTTISLLLKQGVNSHAALFKSPAVD